jgi:hypothetical protein
VQVGDALVGVHHVHGRAVIERGLDVGLDLRGLVGGQGLDLGFQVGDAEVRVDAERLCQRRRTWRKRPSGKR